MGDVSGHGPSAALVMTMVKGIIHAITHALESPADVLTELNFILNEIKPDSTFVTMVFLVIDHKQRVLWFSNAGHNSLIHYDSRSKSCHTIELMGPALSISERAKYGLKEISLQADDVILIYTDGVTEAFNTQGQMFEEHRLIQAVEESGSTTAQSVIEHVKKRLEGFTSEAPQSDDIAMIAIKIG